MKTSAFKTFLALGFFAATLGSNFSIAQQTPSTPSTPPVMQPDGGGNPGGGNWDPCGTVPCAVAVH